MGKLLATLKAILTRFVFGAHGLLAIWQVTVFKQNPRFWYLCAPIVMLVFEGIFTLTIKRSQEWKWFCPSVFLYLAGTVPSIWLLELHKMARRQQRPAINISAIAVGDLDKFFGVKLMLPEIDAEMWVTLIEQCLMLALILGRWMLPKGDLTRDQLSQLLLVYIGTAADIIEFFDSFKDDTISREPVLVLLTLAIWSWSLLQFTVVLTATKSRKSRLSTTSASISDGRGGCCSMDVWGIALNMLLQDAPFLVFRLLLILHYRIISYMNVFFTCKNTLVILLQLYRLYVVRAEARQAAKSRRRSEPRRRHKRREVADISSSEDSHDDSTSSEPEKRKQRIKRVRDDTTCSTGSSSVKGSSASKLESGIVEKSRKCKMSSKSTMTERLDVRGRRRRGHRSDLEAASTEEEDAKGRI